MTLKWALIITAVVVAACLAAHLFQIARPAPTFRILQSNTDGLGPETLSARVPIVIEPLCDAESCVARIVAAGLGRDRTAAVRAAALKGYVISSELVVIVPSAGDTRVKVCHPSGFSSSRDGAARGDVLTPTNLEGAQSVDIALYGDNLLVLPRGWAFVAMSDVEAIGIDSIFSKLLSWMRP
jgi:hypothetical protein